MLGRQEELLLVVTDTNDKRVPEVARVCLSALGAQLRRFKEQILEFDRLITAWHRSNEMSVRLDDIPGVGPALATALVASVADPKAFRSGRNFSAWIGLVPKQHSSGGKDRLGDVETDCRDCLHGSLLWIVGALTAPTSVALTCRVEEPSTASIGDICIATNIIVIRSLGRRGQAAGAELRCPAPWQPEG